MMTRYKQRGGEQVPFTPEEEDEWDAMVAERPAVLAKRAIEDAIAELEEAVTPRRIREAFADPTWINAQEALIAVERDKLALGR